MPVRTQTDTMLSPPSDSLWNDTSFYSSFDEDDFQMKFLDIMDPSDLLGSSVFDGANMDFSDILTAPSSPKYQIRNHDCMWSGTCVDKSHPSKKRGLNFCSASTSTTNTAQQPQTSDTCTTTTTQKPSEKFAMGKTIMTPSSIKTIACKSKIPAGSSLLINSRINTNTAPTKTNQQIKDSLSIDSKEFDAMINANLRPDTPLSLGDDVPEFKNSSIDLTPCPSSNRVKFNDPQSTKIINMLVEHLEDPNCLNDATPIMGAFSSQRNTANDLNDILEDITFLSDYEDMGDDDTSAIDMDEDDEVDFKSSKYNKILTSNAHPQPSSSRTQYQFISDHSYTRQKGSRFDPCELGVQTPSDSEEEIDVVNINEKNLPTNPSARDRRALQTTVAHKIARSKQSNQRRRISDDDSISSSTSTLSSKGSTPIKYGSQTPNRYVYTNGHRKRKDNNNNSSSHESHKKYRHSKKQRLAMKMQKTIDPDEAETIEKRNLHNNMERQRRIGLKNLFEELKCQIPSLKDKERAPKVNILREAAHYCMKLRRDEDLHAELTKKQNRLLTRVRNLKASMAAQQRRNH